MILLPHWWARQQGIQRLISRCGTLIHESGSKCKIWSDGIISATTHAGSNKANGLVYPSKRRNIDGLTANGTLGTDTSRVFTRTSVNDRIDKNLQYNKICGIVNEKVAPTWIGFWSVRRWIISKAWATMRTARSFFPLLRPFIIKLFLID